MAAPPSTSLQFTPIGGASLQGTIALPNAAIAVFGSAASQSCSTLPCVQTQVPLLSILDAFGNQTAFLPASAFGSANSIVTAAATDSAGNIWIAGNTYSDDFPLTHAFFSTKADYQNTGFAAKLDTNLHVLFSTFLGAAHTNASAIAVDTAGNAYVVGHTDDLNFPSTGPVLGTRSPGYSQFGFVTKIAADGSKIIYNRLLGGDGNPCVGGSGCIGSSVYTTPEAIVVDGNGNLIVAGTSNATNFPVTTGVYNTKGGAFVTRIAGDGSQLLWSTEVGTSLQIGSNRSVSTAISVALDATGDVYVTGKAPISISTSQGALQPTAPAPGQYYALELSPDATRLLFATNLGASQLVNFYGLTLDPAGNPWLAVNTTAKDFPGLNNPASAPLDFVFELNANASAISQSFTLLAGTVTQPLSYDSNGSLLLTGSGGNILRLNPATALSAPALFAITNAAVPRATGGIGLGEIATLYGVGLGPASGVSGVPDQNGQFPLQLGGVTVVFSDREGSRLPVPLLYAGPDQINLQTPFSVFQNTETITITTPDGHTITTTLPVTGSLGIFAVVNADGTINGPTNPTTAGSIVSIYATGIGAPRRGAPDGAVSPTALPAFQHMVEVDWMKVPYLEPLPLFYAGTAPGLINGLDQINVQLPFGIQNPEILLSILRLQTPTAQPLTSDPIIVYAY